MFLHFFIFNNEQIRTQAATRPARLINQQKQSFFFILIELDDKLEQ